MRPCAIIVLLVGALALLHADDKKKQQQAYYVKPDQMLDLESPALVTARQNCENWALAAGLETILQKQDVPLDQNFWVMRLNYGELCVQQLPSMDHLAEVVNQEFVLDDGRHVRLALHFFPGAPRDVDALLVNLQRQLPALLLWHGHPYYLTGATYDERIGRDGSRRFEIKEFRLAETFPRQPGVTFQRGRDNLEEIGGLLTVGVTAK